MIFFFAGYKYFYRSVTIDKWNIQDVFKLALPNKRRESSYEGE